MGKKKEREREIELEKKQNSEKKSLDEPKEPKPQTHVPVLVRVERTVLRRGLVLAVDGRDRRRQHDA